MLLQALLLIAAALPRSEGDGLLAPVHARAAFAMPPALGAPWGCPDVCKLTAPQAASRPPTARACAVRAYRSRALGVPGPRRCRAGVLPGLRVTAGGDDARRPLPGEPERAGRGGRGAPRTTRTFNGELQRLARSGDMAGCKRVLKEMDAAGLPWDVFTYNAVLNCQSKARVLPAGEPARLLTKMAEEQIAPNVVTLNTALKFYARTVRLEPALQLLQAMQAKGVVADAITYNTLLNTCCKAGMMSRAEELLQDMLHQGMRPTASTVTTLITGYGRVGDIDEAERAGKLLQGEPAVMRALAIYEYIYIHVHKYIHRYVCT